MQRVSQYLDRLVEKRQIPGIQYLVVDENSVRYEYCAGLRDIGSALPVTPETTFMASSTTKVITAAAVLQLIERGRMRLDAPLSDYYAEHPYGNRVTIRMLLNHTSGIPNPLPLKWLHRVEEDASFDEDAALAAALKSHASTISAPGTRYAYSNPGYWLLGKAIERVSGQTYKEYIRMNILDVLRCHPDQLGFVASNPSLQARGYQKKYSALGLFLWLAMDRSMLEATEQGQYRLARVTMNGPAYGGLIGTAHGFSLFLQDQLRPRSALFGPDTKALFYSPQATSDGKEIGATLGWHRGTVAGHRYFGKPGGGPGFHSNIRLYPDKSIGTVFLANETAVSENRINALADTLDLLGPLNTDDTDQK